ncbi:MAG: transglutaminase-like domain-containing protein [archaeon]
MKKLITLFLFLMFLVTQVIASNETYEEYKQLNINSKINSFINIDYLSSNRDIEYIFANLTFFPREDDFQKITSKNLIYSDEIEEGEDYIYYKWNNPNVDQIQYGLDYDIESEFKLKQIDEKIRFPIISDLPDDINIYLQSTDYINSNNSEIIQQANEIVQGEDDLYEVVFKLGLWTKENINYDLNTQTAELVQNSVWVLNNKQGVCDELNALFIAMLRSVGIPAKFVSGVSYSNTINGFGNHAWAEVYFPDYGWIPYDVTYGQFGYVDASHIKMKESLDAKESSANYGWLANDIDVNVNMDIEANLISTGELNPEYISLDLILLKNDVGPNSYVPIQIKLKNENNFYMSTSVFVTKSPDLIENNRQDVFLKPQEEKSIFWMLHIPNDLEPGYIYTSTVEVIDSFNSQDSESLQYDYDYDTYTLEEAQNKIDELEEEEEQSYLFDLKILCNPSKETFYTYESGKLLCNIENIGNINLNNLQVCFLNECKSIDLFIAESKNVEFSFKLNESNKEYSILANNNQITKYEYVDINVLKSPNLRIENLTYPNVISYNNEGEIKFRLKSDSKAYNVLIKVNKNTAFDLNDFDGNEEFVIPFKGNYFYKGGRKIKIEYKDNNGMPYQLEQELDINVNDVPFYVKIGWWWVLIIMLVLLLVFRNKIREMF